MNIERFALAIVAATACVADAKTATITVSHNDPDGTVEPGQIVQIRYHLRWTDWPYLAVMRGDATVSPNFGIASNPVSGFNGGAVGTLNNPGTPDAGSIRGFRAEQGQVTGFVTPGFAFSPNGVNALIYTWTAPPATQAGVYTFTFEFHPQFPSIFLYPGPVAPMNPVPTTVVPATLTVTPAPGFGGLALASLALVACGRRRH